MKKISLIIAVILSFSVPALSKTYYSIQLLATKNINTAHKILKQAESLPEARIDRIDNYYKVRVGLFNTYREARKFLIKNKIREHFKGAFITKVNDEVLNASETKLTNSSTNKTTNNTTNATLSAGKESSSNQTVTNTENATYSIEIYRTAEKEKAIKFFKNLPERIKKDAFIYKNNKDIYSVRLFLTKDFNHAKEKQKSIEYLHFETEIKPTLEKNILKIPAALEQQTNKTENGKPAKSSPKTIKKDFTSSPTIKTTAKKRTEKITSSRPIRTIYIVTITSAIILTAVLLLIKTLNKKETSGEAKDMYEMLENALKKGNTTLVKEIIIPYLSRYPEDLKAQELYAMALEKEGKYLEAADIYMTIAEVLEGKKQFEKAKLFKKKAEELTNKEFNKQSG
ncbi:SPOR domain-containing protein [Desulfurobacterium sp.]